MWKPKKDDEPAQGGKAGRPERSGRRDGLAKLARLVRRRRHRRPAESLPLELCDLCGVTFPVDEAVCGYVPDSSCVHPTGEWFDGLRRITACGDAHFAVVRDRYRLRPFVQEELWAAKIDRALTSGTPVLTMGQLGCRTGLHEPEIRRAIAWHNAHLWQGTQP